MESTYQIKHNIHNKDETYDEEITWSVLKNKIIKICECSKSIMVGIFDVKRKAFLSCSNSFDTVLGYKPLVIMEGGYRFWCNLIDPREADIVLKRISDFIFCTSHSFNNDAIFLKYHIKTFKGDWRYIKHELELFYIDNEVIAVNYLYDFSEKEVIQNCLGKKNNSIGCKNLLSIDISEREYEVLKLIANGFSSKQIAYKLYISNHTAVSHRKNLIEKFKVNNTAQLIKRATEFIQF